MPLRPVTKKWLKRLLITLVALFTLTALAVVFENWRAKRAWLAYKAEWEAKGERFDRAAFLPPEVPDAQNIAATPLLAPLREWQIDPSASQPVNLPPPAVKEGVQRVYEWLRAVQRGGAGYLAGEFATLEVVEPPPSRMDTRMDTNMMAKYGLLPPPGAPELPAGPVVPEESSVSGESPRVGPSSAEIEAMLHDPSRTTAGNVLAVFDRFSTGMDELALAAERPYLVFGGGQQGDRASTLLPELAVMKGVGNAFRIRALARLAEGDQAGALADETTLLRLGDAMRSEPLLITGLVRLAMLSMAIQPVWEGLARHQWSDDQLRQLEGLLGPLNLVSEGVWFLRAERSYSLHLLDLMLRSPGELARVEPQLAQPGSGWLPRAMIYRNQLAIARMFQEALLSRLDPDKRVVDLAGARANEDPDMETLSGGRPFRPYSVFADMLMPALAPAVEKFAQAQAQVVMARVACALERHHLANGDYPTALASLVPRYLPALPADPAGGGTLHYRLLSVDNFLLYSVGPNVRDDGGKVVRSKSGSVDSRSEECDWVWTYRSWE